MTLTLDDFDLILNVHFIPPATPGLFSPSMSLIGVSWNYTWPLTWGSDFWGLKPLNKHTPLLVFIYNRGPLLRVWYFTVKARTHTPQHFAIQTWTYLIQTRTYLKVYRQTVDLVLHLLWGTYAHMLLYAIWHPLLVSYDRGRPRLAVFDFSLHKCGLKVHGCRWKRAPAYTFPSNIFWTFIWTFLHFCVKNIFSSTLI